VHDYAVGSDAVRLALVLGVVLSVVVYERTHVTTGGVIVPGYLALYVGSPQAVVATLAVAYATHRIVTGPIARRWILYGRRKFEIEVVIGLSLTAAVAVLAAIATVVGRGAGSGPGVATGLGLGVGFVLPGIIAHDMGRQGPRTTLAAIVPAAGVVAVVVTAVGAVDRWVAGEVPAGPLPASAVGGHPLAFGLDLLLVAVIVSVLVGLAIRARTGLRTGGFVSAAYLALASPSPLDLGFVVVVAALSLVVVRFVLEPHMHVFGRRRLAATLVVAVLLGWSLEIALAAASGGAVVPWPGFASIGLVVAALVAGDAARQGVARTAAGVTAATAFVLAAMAVIGALAMALT
jgi:poly-gamma-glutamate biosynthesis protein PgsC/CapC